MTTIRSICICSGNICRSPMALALLREKYRRRQIPAVVISAGTLNIQGRRAADFARGATPPSAPPPVSSASSNPQKRIQSRAATSASWKLRINTGDGQSMLPPRGHQDTIMHVRQTTCVRGRPPASPKPARKVKVRAHETGGQRCPTPDVPLCAGCVGSASGTRFHVDRWQTAGQRSKPPSAASIVAAAGALDSSSMWA